MDWWRDMNFDQRLFCALVSQQETLPLDAIKEGLRKVDKFEFTWENVVGLCDGIVNWPKQRRSDVR